MGMSFGMSWGDSLSSLKRKGEIWKMAEPVEGTMWWVDEYAITWTLSDQPFKKKIAEEWINRCLSPDYQINHLIRELGVYPVVTNISDKISDEERKRVKISSEIGSFKENRILQYKYSQRDRNGLKLLWDEAMKGIPLKIKGD